MEGNCHINYCIEIKSTGIPAYLKLPEGFTPSAAFRLVKDQTKYFAFVEQKPESSNPGYFRRRYYVHNVSADQLFPNLTSDPFYDKTFAQKKDFIIGTMAQWDQGWSEPPIVYSRKGSIMHCSLPEIKNISDYTPKRMLEMAFNEVSEVVLKTYNK